MSVGSLIEGKNPLAAVETVAELRSRGVDANLTWVGDGYLRDSVVERVESLGLGAHIRLVGRVQPSEVGRYLDAADAFLLPTRAETFCVAAAEALVHGRPVVVGSNGGQREFVGPPFGELVDDVDDPRALGDALLRVVGHAVREGSDAVALSVGQRFSPEQSARRYTELYESLIKAT